MDFIVENSLAGKRKREEPIPMVQPEVKKQKVYLVQRKDRTKVYMTEEQFIIAQKRDQEVKKIRELNI